MSNQRTATRHDNFVKTEDRDLGALKRMVDEKVIPGHPSLEAGGSMGAEARGAIAELLRQAQALRGEAQLLRSKSTKDVMAALEAERLMSLVEDPQRRDLGRSRAAELEQQAVHLSQAAFEMRTILAEHLRRTNAAIDAEGIIRECLRPALEGLLREADEVVERLVGNGVPLQGVPFHRDIKPLGARYGSLRHAQLQHLRRVGGIAPIIDRDDRFAEFSNIPLVWPDFEASPKRVVIGANGATELPHEPPWPSDHTERLVWIVATPPARQGCWMPTPDEQDEARTDWDNRDL